MELIIDFAFMEMIFILIFKPSVLLYFIFHFHSGAVSPVRQPTCPTTHFHDKSLHVGVNPFVRHPLVRQPTCPYKTHFSDNPLVRQPTCPTNHFNKFMKTHLFDKLLADVNQLVRQFLVGETLLLRHPYFFYKSLPILPCENLLFNQVAPRC